MDTVEAEIDQIITDSISGGIAGLRAQESAAVVAQEHLDSLMMDGNAIRNVEGNAPAEEAETEQEDAASIEIFNTALHQYLRVDEEIKSLMAAIKERNDIKRKLADTLSNYLKAKQIKKVNLDGSYKGKRLEVEVKTTNTGFNKTSVTEAILSELQEDAELFDKIMRAISKTSILKEVWKIKVTEEKAAKAAAAGGGTSKRQTKAKGRKLGMGTSMADAAALLDDA